MCPKSEQLRDRACPSPEAVESVCSRTATPEKIKRFREAVMRAGMTGENVVMPDGVTVSAGTIPVPDNVRRFDTGAVRSKDADATRYDLITPIGLRAVAQAYAEGSAKYGDFNCEKGFPVHDLLNHAIRHLYLFLEGDRSEPHLGHAAWNVLMAIHSEAMWPNLNAGHLRGPGCAPPPKPFEAL